MKVFNNPQFKTNRGIPVVVEGNLAMTPLLILESALTNAKASKEVGGLSLARDISRLGVKLCQVKVDAKTVKVEADELKTLKTVLALTAGSFPAIFEDATNEVLEDAKEVKQAAPAKAKTKKTPIRSRK